MPFGNEIRDCARRAELPDWLKNFANEELQKIETNNMSSQGGVEGRVRELQKRVGLDLVFDGDMSKVASIKKATDENEFNESETQKDIPLKAFHRYRQLLIDVWSAMETDEEFRVALEQEYQAALVSSPKMSIEDYVKGKVEDLVKSEQGLDAEDKPTGGLAEGKPDSDFNEKQLAKGIKVEMEHTDDPTLAKQISKDHLVENEKYYDFLEKCEEKMKEAGKNANEIVSVLVVLANTLDEMGDTRGSNIIDKKLNRIAKEEKEKLKIFDEFPKIKIFVDNLCKSRAGHVSLPAVLKMLRDERPEKIDIGNGELKDYIKMKLQEEKKDIGDEGDDIAGLNHTVFVVTEDDDGNSDVFSSPAVIRR